MSTPRITAHVYDYIDPKGQKRIAFVHEDGARRMVRILQEDGAASLALPAAELPGKLVGPVGYHIDGAYDLVVPPSVEKRWVLLPPVVYRYMPQRYIDEFFATGRLMLGSFARFKQHADEQRGDDQEGLNIISATCEDLTVVMGTQHGTHSLILSTSVKGDEHLMREFGCDGYFRIVDTHYFGRAIGDRLTGFTDGLEGFCTYRDHHVIKKKIPASVAGTFNLNPKDDPDLEQAIGQVAGIGGAEVLFSKRRQYEHQAEYRIVWNLVQKVEGSLMVECPEAIRFCERVT